MDLSDKQRQVVDSVDQYMCVIAGAGSGKTHTLTERIKKLISANKRGERVLAITFSNKAARELKERLLHSYSQSELNELSYIGTVHNFCMEIVTQRATSIGLPGELHIFESFEDRFEIFKTTLVNIPQMKDQCLDYKGNLDAKKVRNLFEKFSNLKRNLKFPEDYHKQPLLQRLYQDYNDLMLSQNAIDFDDILLYAYKILIEKPAIARIYHRIYKHICVDESQDLNKAQYAVIKAIAGSSASLLMVGDPNQAIYGFNGSSPKYMCEKFSNDFEVVQYNLDENYRSSKTVIEAAQIIEPTFKMVGKLPITGQVSIHSFNDELEEANWVASMIEHLSTQGHDDIEGKLCLPEQFAVLARNRYVFNTLESLFNERDIKYNIRVSANKDLMSESTFFKVFDLGLRLIMNPSDVLHFEEMKILLAIDSRNTMDFDTLRASAIFQNLLSQEGSVALNSAWDKLKSQTQNFRFDKILSTLSAYFTSDNNIEVNELALLHNDHAAWDNRWRFYVKNSSAEERSLAHMMRAIALGITNTTSEDGITLSTVHMSKGLEFNVVFIIGLNDGVFPDYRTLNEPTKLSEEQHNMFVAITRSKRLCYLSFPCSRIMPWGDTKDQRKSRYVDALSHHFSCDIYTN
ncbi:MAG: ATP-dependent helicase [Defluviitaleaceae bacterium]|nr:ATP-dependent helicase [Defluviitaleaceae bacterium]